MVLSVHRKDLDVNKCIRMTLVHDIGEAIIGDITPHCGVSREEKFRREKQAVKTISNWLPETESTEWKSLWREYDTGQSAEAKAVKHLDKLEMHSVDLTEFFISTLDDFPDEPFASWASQIRQKRWAQKEVVN